MAVTEQCYFPARGQSPVDDAACAGADLLERLAPRIGLVQIDQPGSRARMAAVVPPS